MHILVLVLYVHRAPLRRFRHNIIISYNLLLLREYGVYMIFKLWRTRVISAAKYRLLQMLTRCFIVALFIFNTVDLVERRELRAGIMLHITDYYYEYLRLYYRE